MNALSGHLLCISDLNFHVWYNDLKVQLDNIDRTEDKSFEELGYGLLTFAARFGYVHLMEALVDARVDINGYNSYYGTALSVTEFYGVEASVYSLLRMEAENDQLLEDVLTDFVEWESILVESDSGIPKIDILQLHEGCFLPTLL